MTTASIFDIQRFSIHDGPGIRTTVFLKGCPLRCAWCHNPESVSGKPALSFVPEKCIGCGYCFKACRHGAHILEPPTASEPAAGAAVHANPDAASSPRHTLDRAKCIACGRCVEKCYAGALELVGREMSVEEVLREVLSDRPFYETSGGGMTLSGGEPLYQIDFTESLLAAAKAQGLHNCIETCGFADFELLRRVMPYVDLFLYDLKDTDSRRHKANTGVPNEPILENLRMLVAAGARILVRIPLIPGYNDFEDNLRGMAQLGRSLPGLLGMEIMPYHKLGVSKLGRFGIMEPERLPEVVDDATMTQWIATLAAAGITVVNKPPQAVGRP